MFTIIKAFIGPYIRWIEIGIVVFIFSIITWFYIDYKHTKAALAVTKENLVTSQANVKAVQDNQATYKVNNDNVNALQNEVAKIASKQAAAKEKADNVQIQKNDSPFADPSLLARAGIMRDYEESQQLSSSSANPPH
jgi:uncharacterized membrane protein (DUF106 family)